MKRTHFLVFVCVYDTMCMCWILGGSWQIPKRTSNLKLFCPRVPKNLMKSKKMKEKLKIKSRFQYEFLFYPIKKKTYFCHLFSKNFPTFDNHFSIRKVETKNEKKMRNTLRKKMKIKMKNNENPY